ncbi:MAG: hypothetical protein ACT4ON_08500 [Bacteroidota bacterium]
MKDKIFKSIFLSFICFSSAEKIFSQDTLNLINGQKSIVQVIKIGISEIEYKRFDNLTGPLYVIEKKDILSITYKNGTKDAFPENVTIVHKLKALPTTNLTQTDVINAKTITFYGFDFTNFRLLEPQRIYESKKIRDIHFPGWNQYVMGKASSSVIADWFDKSEVIYDVTTITKQNSLVNENNVVATMYNCNLDSIKYSVANYEKNKDNMNKIGIVVNVEYFDKSKNEASAYITFFDMGTGGVISSEKVTNNYANGIGLTNYWGVSLVEMIRDYKSGIRTKIKGW